MPLSPPRCLAALIPVLFVVPLLALGGCGGGGGVLGRPVQTQVPIEGDYLQPQYGTRVEIDNVSGSVRVVVDPSRPSPEVRANIRRTGRGAPGARDLAEQIEVSAQALMDDDVRVLRVQTTAPPELEDFAVDLQVRVPRSAGAVVRNANGWVELVQVSGPIRVENGIAGQPGGNVQVRTNAAITQPVQITTTTGGIRLQMGPGSSGTVALRSDSGRAEFNTRYGVVNEVESGASWWRGVLNGGENPIVLHAGDGRVRLLVMERAGDYGPGIWDGSVPERWVPRRPW